MKKKYLISLLLSGLFFLFSCGGMSVNNKVVSPDGILSCQIESLYDSLFFNLEFDGEKVIDASPLLLEIDGTPMHWEIERSISGIWKDVAHLEMGENAQIAAEAGLGVFELKGSSLKEKDLKAQLQVRVFDKAVAYRFVLDLPYECKVEEKSRLMQTNLQTTYFIPNGEFEPFGDVTIGELNGGRKYGSPLVWKKDSMLIELHETCLYNYPALAVCFDKVGNSVKLAQGEAILKGRVELPWRVFTVGRSWEDLHNAKQLYYSLSVPANEDYGWVESGISMWDWRVRGCTFTGFKYDINTESLQRFIDFAADNNIKYCLVDAHWYQKSNPLQPIPEMDIQEVIRYGEQRGVGIWLYYDLGYMKHSKKEVDFKEVAKTYSEWGAKGIKYGFLGTIGTKYSNQGKVRKTEEVIRIAAKYKLMLNFHDNPIPFSGLERTYPNYLSREFCHAQMDRRAAFTPNQFVKMACINFLAGPMDQSNGVYELNRIKERSKGPKNEFNSTAASENARFFITHTGHLSVLIDAPEAYRSKADLFEFIKKLPARWDETKYLNMDINSHVCIARRSGDSWYVGTVYNEDGGTHELILDFLQEGASYEMTLFQDGEDAHYIRNKEKYAISKRTVSKNEYIQVEVVPGGGYTAIIKKI